MVNYFECEELEKLKNFVHIIDEGGVVIYPTDTVYGIGCDATIEKSIIRLYQTKNRPFNKSLPILTWSVEEVSKVATVTPLAKKLFELFWPGQLTIVLKAKNLSGLSKLTTNPSNDSIAIRIPDDNCIRSVIKMTKSKFLVGTSANISQGPSITRFANLDPKLIRNCDAVLRRESSSESKGESTIVDISNEASPQIVRQGSLPKDKIIEVLNLNN